MNVIQGAESEVEDKVKKPVKCDRNNMQIVTNEARYIGQAYDKKPKITKNNVAIISPGTYKLIRRI